MILKFIKEVSMKTTFRSLALIVVSIFTVVNIQAQTRSVGLNAMQFLNVGVGARSAAMGLSTTAVSNDVDQIFYNPAGSALKDEMLQASVNYTSWLAGISQNCLAVSYNWKNVGTVSLGIQTFGASDIPGNRDLAIYGGSDKSTTDVFAKYNYLDMGISLTYARYLLDNLSLGLTAKYLNESIDGENIHTLAFDVGSVYDIGLANWKIAARLSNLGNDVSYFFTQHPIPMAFSIGTSFMPVNQDMYKLLLSVEALKTQEEEQAAFAGAEFTVSDMVSLRGGYKFNYSGTQSGTDYFSTNSILSRGSATNVTIEKFSLGVGIKIPLNEYIIDVDYAYTKMDIINDIHRIGLKFNMK